MVCGSFIVSIAGCSPLSFQARRPRDVRRRESVALGVEAAFEAAHAGICIASTTKEYDMPEVKLSWFDRLLIKIAIAKAVARGFRPIDPASLARSLKEAFAVTRAP